MDGNKVINQEGKFKANKSNSNMLNLPTSSIKIITKVKGQPYDSPTSNEVNVVGVQVGTDAADFENSHIFRQSDSEIEYNA